MERESGNRLPGRLLLPSLSFARLAVHPPSILVGLFLIEIGAAFGLSVAVAAQMQTVYSFVGIAGSFMMGLLSLRFAHKHLMMSGMLLVCISSVGCYVAPDFVLLLLVYAISGLGSAMVIPMSTTLVGEHFSVEKRTGAVGWITAGASMSYVVAAPSMTYIAGLWTWRTPFILFVLPVALSSLILIVRAVPTPQHQGWNRSSEEYCAGFSGVLRKTSAVACLVSTAFLLAGYQAVLLYSSSFYRQEFNVSIGLVSVFFFVGAFCFTVGGLVSNRFVNRLGRRKTSVFIGALAGLMVGSYMSLPNLWISLAGRFVGGFLTGLTATAVFSLTLEQVPEYRGTMMSVASAASSMGSALGASVGGICLSTWNYQLLGIVLGTIMTASAPVLHLFSEDPTK